MHSLGRGTVLFVNGGAGARPNPKVAGTSIAFAGESAYVRMLHDKLAPKNIHVGQLVIPSAIEAGHPNNDPRRTRRQTAGIVHPARRISACSPRPCGDRPRR